MSEAISVARRLIEIVGDRAEAEATVALSNDALTRFANSFIHQNVGEQRVDVRLRLAAEGRVAAMTGNLATDDALEALASDALAAAAFQPVDEEWPGVAGTSPVPPGDHVAADTIDVTPDARAEVVRRFIDAGDGFLAAGYCDTSHAEVAFANSAGQEASGRTTRAALDGIHQTGESAGSAHQTSRSFGDLDGEAAGLLAADRARRGMGAFDLKPGDYEVVLSPECVATVAIFLAFYGFNGKAVEEGASFVDLGAKQFDERVTMIDDPVSGTALGVPFDTEGTPKASLDMIRDGVTSGVTHDRRTARKASVASTGHAHASSVTWGPFAQNALVVPGDTPVEDMIAGVERGLYVATLNYCRILDPKTQVVTGLTRNGTFMIENGEITGAVTNLRFTQSFLEALGDGNVLAIGDDLRYADCEFGGGMVRAPSMRLASWHFTGGAEG
jgi:predicted Zn-dependent protease